MPQYFHDGSPYHWLVDALHSSALCVHVFMKSGSLRAAVLQTGASFIGGMTVASEAKRDQEAHVLHGCLAMQIPY